MYNTDSHISLFRLFVQSATYNDTLVLIRGRYAIFAGITSSCMEKDTQKSSFVKKESVLPVNQPSKLL